VGGAREPKTTKTTDRDENGYDKQEQATWSTRALDSGIATHPDITPRCSDAILDSQGGAARAPLCMDSSRPSPPFPPSPAGDVALIPVALSGVCMAMHYSNNDERAATIIAYPKEGNATVLNVRFLCPRCDTPIHYIERSHCPMGLIDFIRGRPRCTARKFDVLILHHWLNRMHTNTYTCILYFSFLVLECLLFGKLFSYNTDK